MTQKGQHIDDLKSQNVQDIDDPNEYKKLCYTLSQSIDWELNNGTRIKKKGN